MLLSFFGLAVLAVNAVSLDPHCKDDGTVITRKPSNNPNPHPDNLTLTLTQTLTR